MAVGNEFGFVQTSLPQHIIAIRLLLASLLGAMLGLMGFVRGAWTHDSTRQGVGWNELAMTISLSVMSICIWGTLIGAMLPLAFRKFGIDPAFASSSFVAKGPVDSIRWETIRDGIEDWDYFRMLQDKIDAASETVRATPRYVAARDALKEVNDCIVSRTDYCKDPARAESIGLKVALALEAL